MLCCNKAVAEIPDEICNTVQPSSIFILGHIIAFRMPHDAGNRCSIVNMLIKMCGARGALCSLATLLKTAPFHAEFGVFVWRGSLRNPKKLISILHFNRVCKKYTYGYDS